MFLQAKKNMKTNFKELICDILIHNYKDDVKRCQFGMNTRIHMQVVGMNMTNMTGWTFEWCILGAIIKRVVCDSRVYRMYCTVYGNHWVKTTTALPRWQKLDAFTVFCWTRFSFLIGVQYRFWYMDMFEWSHVFLFSLTEDDGALSWQKGGGA